MNEELDRLERLIGVIEDQNRNTRSLEGTIEQLIPALLKTGNPPATNTARTNITQTNTTPMWVCVVIVVALAVGLWGRGDSEREDISRLRVELNDVRNDARELRAADQELRATDNAVRAYINTGILKPKPQEVGKQ